MVEAEEQLAWEEPEERRMHRGSQAVGEERIDGGEWRGREERLAVEKCV